GLRRYAQGHTRDGFYGIGEASLDCVEQLWFESVEDALAAQHSVQQQLVDADYRVCAEERYVHKLLVREHWIIGPKPREYLADRVVRRHTVDELRSLIATQQAAAQ